MVHSGGAQKVEGKFRPEPWFQTNQSEV